MLRRISAFALGLALAAWTAHAQAACAGITSGLNLITGGATAHITYVNLATCVPIGPGGVTVTSNAAIATAVADATGFVVTPVAPGSFTLSLNSTGFATASVGVSVIAGTTATGITSP